MNQHTQHVRPLGVPHIPTPEELEQIAADMVICAEVVTDLQFPVTRENMYFANRVALSLGFTLLWPSTVRAVSAVPTHIWREAVRINNEARKLRAARAGMRAMRVIRSLPPVA